MLQLHHKGLACNRVLHGFVDPMKTTKNGMFRQLLFQSYLHDLWCANQPSRT